MWRSRFFLRLDIEDEEPGTWLEGGRLKLDPAEPENFCRRDVDRRGILGDSQPGPRWALAQMSLQRDSTGEEGGFSRLLDTQGKTGVPLVDASRVGRRVPCVKLAGPSQVLVVV
jgi:hypothetical protein